MNIYVLSELTPDNHHVGWSVSHGLEGILATTCNAHFLYPQPTSSTPTYLRSDEPVPFYRRDTFFRRASQRLFKSWYSLEQLPTLGEPPNILLVIGMSPSFLLSMFSLGPLLDQFDVRIGYILDGFSPEHFRKPALAHLDHLYVISAELADEMREMYSLDTSFLPLGVNTFHFEQRVDRPIDIIGYGRIHRTVHQYLQKHFNQAPSDRLYYHSTFDQETVNNPEEHITLRNKLLSRSKLSLCFEASNVPRFRGQSPLVYRWLEGWAAGCAIVGKRPFGKGVAELIDWQDSTIEIPDDPQDWIPFFEAWLNDEDRLARISVRNQIECRLRHDWRYRLRSIFQQFSLPIPELLTAEIAQLQTCLQPADALKQSLPVLDQDTDRTQAPEPQEIPLRVLS